MKQQTYTIEAIETAFFNHREGDGCDHSENYPDRIQRVNDWRSFKQQLASAACSSDSQEKEAAK
jgi:hypothetical protein